MQDIKKFCIVIPIYNEIPEITEKYSLKRLYDVLKNKKYDIFFIHGKSFNSKQYYKLFHKKIFDKDFITDSITFDDKYFSSTESYSKLLISYDFYNTFSNYEYMLIYQTDCYLFEDKINEWCDKKYDYIGAPIIAYNKDWSLTLKGIPQVGNGGFSLRKISTFKNITNPNGEFKTYYKITEDSLADVKYEDVWFCDFVYFKYEFNIPIWNEAMLFSLDMNVKIFYNDFKIQFVPMGCHAWPKNIRDWKDKFDNMTQEIIDYCENKYKDYFKLYYASTNNNSK